MNKTCCDTYGHNCNQGRTCPARARAKNRHTCDELGVCQCPAPGARPGLTLAPGTIEGPGDVPVVFMDDDGPWLPLSAGEALKLLVIVLLVCLVLGVLAGYLVERFA